MIADAVRLFGYGAAAIVALGAIAQIAALATAFGGLARAIDGLAHATHLGASAAHERLADTRAAIAAQQRSIDEQTALQQAAVDEQKAFFATQVAHMDKCEQRYLQRVATDPPAVTH